MSLELAEALGMKLELRSEARLAAAAALDYPRLYLATPRQFTLEEAARIAIHEILGHAVNALNASTQPLALLRQGTCDSLASQEGVALCLEEAASTLSPARLRTLAARVLVTYRMHEGASFHDNVYSLIRESAFEVEDALRIAERVYRGGGASRDGIYLRAWLETRALLRASPALLDRLRSAKIAWRDLPHLEGLEARGLYREASCRPRLSESLAKTSWGTLLRTSDAPSALPETARLVL